MKFIYPAIIHKKEDGRFRADFPDLSGCQAEGESLDEVIERANEAASDWIGLELSEEDGELPAVSDVRDLTLSEHDIVRNICVNIRFQDGWDE